MAVLPLTLKEARLDCTAILFTEVFKYLKPIYLVPQPSHEIHQDIKVFVVCWDFRKMEGHHYR